MTPLPAVLHRTQSRITLITKKKSQRDNSTVLENRSGFLIPTLFETDTMVNSIDGSISLRTINSRKFSLVNSKMSSLSRCGYQSQVNISQVNANISNEHRTAKVGPESEENGVSEVSKNLVATTDAIASSTKPQRILLKNINDHISCSICTGYLIDATTIVECLHSFCRSCIMNHLKQEHSCPQCKMIINTAKPNIKSDTTLQAIVYKLVPGLYEKELMRKRAFYRDRPIEAMLASPEQRGDDTENLIFGPTENMSLSLEYADLDDITSGDISTLRSPKYLQCPAIFSIAHLKKFIIYKFAVDYRTFNVEVMYKVKTIVLPDHYTLMDVAYIYTWKRDAPMRFFFRVRENNNASNEVHLKEQKKTILDAGIVGDKESEDSTNKISEANTVKSNMSTDLHPPTNQKVSLKESEEIEETLSASNKEGSVAQLEVEKSKSVAQLTTMGTPNSTASFSLDHREISPKADKIKLTLINKNKMIKNGASAIYESNIEKASDSRNENMNVSLKPSKSERSYKTGKSSKHHQSQRENSLQQNHHQKVKEGEERKIENIKLKIDLSKQSSITIINMSSPDCNKKDNNKPSKSDKEWKLKSRKDKDDKLGSLRTFVSSPNVKRSKSEKTKDDSKKAFRVTNIYNVESKAGKSGETYSKSLIPKQSKDNVNVQIEKNEEEMKSEFLNSFALTPIKACGIQEKAKKTGESTESTIIKKVENFAKSDVNALCIDSLLPPLPNTTIKLPLAASKRKVKDAPKQLPKRFKEELQETSVPSAEHKRRTPTKAVQEEPQTISFKLAPFPIGGGQASSIDLTKDVDEKLMPAPPPLKILRAFRTNDTNHQKNNKSAKSLVAMKAKMDTTNNISFYKPIFATGANRPAPPGSRTPTTRRYPYILPRPNPFANIQADASKTVQSNDTELKNSSSSYNFDINTCTSPMIQENSTAPSKSSVSNSIQAQSSLVASHHKLKPPSQTNYLNLALLNATKGKVSDVSIGSKTPLYTPNSPIYSPNSPQYMPNYNIPTQPTYKYTKSQSNVSKYLSSVLGQNQQLSGLFPAPPVKKPNDFTQSNTINASGDSFTVKKVESPNKSASVDTLENTGNDDSLLKTSSKPPGTSAPSEPLQKSISKSTDSTVSNSVQSCEDKIKQTIEENKCTQSYSFANSLNSLKSEGVSDPPEKQAKVKSLLNSCKINIPSSLSITITTEENDSQSKSSANSKLKSPVNNYIEILKLPENPPPSAKSNSVVSTDVKVSQRLFGQQIRRMPQSLESSQSNYSNEGSVANESNIQTKSVGPIQDMKTSPTQQFKPVTGAPFNKQNHKEQFSQVKLEKKTAQFASEKNLDASKSNTNKSSKNLTPEKEIENHITKSNFSPSKHSGALTNTTPTNNKSSKEQEISPSKKFRPILPRVELLSKDTSKPFLATSSSTLLNNSVSVYNKSEKKSPPSKTGKTALKNQKTSKRNLAGQAKTLKAITESKPSSKKIDEIVDLTATPPLCITSNPMPNESNHENCTDDQSNSNVHAEKNTERPVDMSSFIETSMRQLHSSNDIYMSNLAAAASFNPHFASVNLGYNLHQAMLLEQFSRIQKAGRDAFERFIENSKGKTDGSAMPTIKEELESSTPKVSPTTGNSEKTKR